MKRYLLCTRSTPFDGDPRLVADSVDPDGFESKEQALQLVSVFPGKGFGYVFDTVECRAVHLFEWKRSVPTN